jgi:hypothetical protein
VLRDDLLDLAARLTGQALGLDMPAELGPARASSAGRARIGPHLEAPPPTEANGERAEPTVSVTGGGTAATGHPWRGLEIRWARERGWLAVRDPADGRWHEVPARDCPESWRRAANRARSAPTDAGVEG